MKVHSNHILKDTLKKSYAINVKKERIRKK